MSKIFHFLTIDDEMRLAEASHRNDYAAGDTIISKGDHHQSIVIVHDGTVNVQIGGVVIARRGPGAVLGEIGFLRNQGASADLVAATAVTVEIIDGRQLNALLFSIPGLATRFYMSLSEVLAERLQREVARTQDTPDAVRMPQFRTVDVEDDAGFVLPEASTELVRELNTKYHAWDPRSDGEALRQLFTRAFTEVERLAREAPGSADPIYRFVQELDMVRASPFHASALRRKRSFAADVHTMSWLDGAAPEIDPRSAKAHDGLLGVPTLAALAARPSALAEIVTSIGREWQSEAPLPVALMGCSSAREAKSVLDAIGDGGGAATLTYVDPDPASVAMLDVDLGEQIRLERVQVNALLLLEEGETHLDAQQVIIVPGLADFLGDGELERWAAWCCSRLLPGGHLLLTHLDADALGVSYLHQGLLWPLHRRTAAQLEALLAFLNEHHAVRFISLKEGGWIIDVHHQIIVAE